MANRNSYSYQKELLVMFKEQLEMFKEELSNATSNYKTSLQNLQDEGLMVETYEEYYENYLAPTIEDVETLVSRIENEDVAFIEKELDFLSGR